MHWVKTVAELMAKEYLELGQQEIDFNARSWDLEPGIYSMELHSNEDNSKEVLRFVLR